MIWDINAFGIFEPIGYHLTCRDMETMQPDEWEMETTDFLFCVQPAHISKFGIDVCGLWRSLYRKVCPVRLNGSLTGYERANKCAINEVIAFPLTCSSAPDLQACD